MISSNIGAEVQVSIHAPTRGATMAGHRTSDHDSHNVSIHAPTRGATRQGRSFDTPSTPAEIPVVGVSIHAPTRGATESFDPRPHARGDAAEMIQSPSKSVSIHAPTRGATVRAHTRMFRSGMPTMFRSTPPREGRRWSFHLSFGHLITGPFRSTPPREGRQLSKDFPRQLSRFDPRPHARGDRRRGEGAAAGFDPRPHARGDRLLFGSWRQYNTVSIHAPTRGATAIAQVRKGSIQKAACCFDPRPHARGDSLIVIC